MNCLFEALKGEVHIWHLQINSFDSLATAYEQVLTEEELNRAANFRFQHLRRSFVITRGVLRHLLARYAKEKPGNLRFSYNSNGKPALLHDIGLRFNVTHSGNMAAIAIAADCDVGLDVELFRPIAEIKQIASSFFCKEEFEEIMGLPLNEREQAFFYCWTRKEALIKAVGDGLSMPLDSFRVSIRPDEAVRILYVGDDLMAAQTWTLHDLKLAPGYAAALAYAAPPHALSVFPISNPSELNES